MNPSSHYTLNFLKVNYTHLNYLYYPYYTLINILYFIDTSWLKIVQYILPKIRS